MADTSTGAELIFAKFFESFTNADTEGVVALFAEDALFWGTGSQTLVRDIEGIRSYFSGLGNFSPGQRIASAVEISIVELNEQQEMVSGTWQVSKEGSAQGTILRVSAVVSNKEGEWKIIQFHNSRVPE